MHHDKLNMDLGSFPATIPLFPLSGVLLLPNGRLPLQVFEPRYQKMVTDSFARDRLIGIVQPRVEASDPVPDHTPLYTMGCAGKVVEFAEISGGRFLITLGGLCRFDILDESLTDNGYRRAMADFEPYKNDLLEDTTEISDRKGLLNAAKAYFAQKEVPADWEGVEDAPDDILVTSFAMACPFRFEEKQALLECKDTEARAELLKNLLRMSIHDDGSEPSSFTH